MTRIPQSTVMNKEEVRGSICNASLHSSISQSLPCLFLHHVKRLIILKLRINRACEVQSFKSSRRHPTRTLCKQPRLVITRGFKRLASSVALDADGTLLYHANEGCAAPIIAMRFNTLFITAVLDIYITYIYTSRNVCIHI